jgi:tetratricopeptide (TPR) repeat protein
MIRPARDVVRALPPGRAGRLGRCEAVQDRFGTRSRLTLGPFVGRAGYSLLTATPGLLAATLLCSAALSGQQNDRARAEAALASGDLAGTTRALEGWVLSHPQDAAARVHLGKAYLLAGKPDRAEAELRRALSIEPGNPDALLALGSLYNLTGAPAEAEPFLRRAVRASPDNAAAHLEWATALSRLHRYTEAAAALKGVPPPQAPSQQIAYFRLKAAIDSGNGHSDAAAADMEAALRLRPDDVDLLTATALAETEARRADAAIRHLEAAARLAPQRPEIAYHLALAQFHTGKLDAAWATAERAVQLGDHAALESLRGDIAEARGDSLTAVRCYQAAVALAPGEEQYRLALGAELLRHQTFEPALAVFEQAAQLFPQSVRARVAKGLTLFFLERYADAAHTLLETARSTSGPESALAFHYLGEVALDEPSTPDPPVAQALCQQADASPRDGDAAAYCGAVLLKIEHDRGNARPSAEALRYLGAAARISPASQLARCQLGKALEWAQAWARARSEMEACVRLNPDSAEAHYRLSRIYERLGEAALAQKERLLQAQAVRRLTEENARRDSTLKKFLYTLRDQAPAR